MRVLALPGEDAAGSASAASTCTAAMSRDQAAGTAAMDGMDAVLHLAAMMDVWRPMRTITPST